MTFSTVLTTESCDFEYLHCVGPAIPVNSYFQQEFPSLPAAGDQEKSGKDKDASEELHGSGPNLRPQSKYIAQIFVKLQGFVWHLLITRLLVPRTNEMDELIVLINTLLLWRPLELSPALLCSRCVENRVFNPILQFPNLVSTPWALRSIC